MRQRQTWQTDVWTDRTLRRWLSSGFFLRSVAVNVKSKKTPATTYNMAPNRRPSLAPRPPRPFSFDPPASQSVSPPLRRVCCRCLHPYSSRRRIRVSVAYCLLPALSSPTLLDSPRCPSIRFSIRHPLSRDLSESRSASPSIDRSIGANITPPFPRFLLFELPPFFCSL